MSSCQSVFQTHQYILNNLFYNDLLFYVSDFLSDNDACHLFNTCKTINKIVKKYQYYSIKSEVTDELNVPLFYKITKMNTSNKFTKLPKSLLHLTISGESDESIIFPQNIINLEWRGSFFLSKSELPSKLNNLHISGLRGNVNLPESVTNLSIINCPEFNTDNLPISLKYLFIHGNFNNVIDYLPKNLKHLGLSDNFNQSVNYLPSSLKYLKLGSKFNQSIDNLPYGLTHLILGYEFNKPINNLPDSIVYLVLGNDFNYPLPPLPNLKILTIDNYYAQSLENIPSTTKIFRTL